MNFTHGLSLFFHPKSFGQIKDRIDEIKDTISGQHIFIMQIFQNDSQIRIEIIVITGTDKTIGLQKNFYFFQICIFSDRNICLPDNCIKYLVFFSETY